MTLMRRLSALGVILAMLGVAFVILTTPVQAQNVPNGPWVDQVIWSVTPDESQAVTDVIEGNSDLYFWAITGLDDQERLLDSPEADAISTFSFVNDLTYNPMAQRAEFPMNPFALRDVREAMNWLIDRQVIIDDIYGGRAKVMVSPFHPSSSDYGRFIDLHLQLEETYRGNTQLAIAQIAEAMEAAGASLNSDGQWVDPLGRLIVIKIWSRQEDLRSAIGAYTGQQLELAGFEVDVIPVTFEVVLDLYFGPPDQNLWHIYTGGWVFTTGFFLDDSQVFDFHGCYWEAWCLEAGTPNGYRPPDALWDAGLTVWLSAYSSLEERDQLLRQALPLAVQENYRMWILAQASLFPITADASAAYDLMGGVAHFLAQQSFRFEDSSACSYEGGDGCTARFVNRRSGTDFWNPHQFTQSYYDAIVRDSFLDPGVMIHPHTFRYVPHRQDFVVLSAGPTGTLDVPSTAVWFNTSSMAWEPVGDDVTAVSRVEFTPAYAPWHHGPMMNVEDIKMNIATVMRMAFGDISMSLPNALTGSEKFFLTLYKGFEFTGSSYVVYLDFFNFETGLIAAQASWWTDVPWDVMMLLAKGYVEQDFANRRTDADALSIPVVDLTKGAALTDLADDLTELAGMDAVPPGSAVSATEAAERWTALQSWVDTYGHYWPSNGGFMLTDVVPETFSFTMEAFRDYPFPADRYEALRTPQIPEVTFTSVPDEVIAGTDAVLTFTSTVGGQPYDDVEVKWLFKDPTTGAILGQGDGVQVSAGTYEVSVPASITVELTSGSYEVINVVVGADAAVPNIQRVSVTVLSLVDWVSSEVAAVESSLQTEISALEAQNQELQTQLQAASDAVNALSGLVTALAALAVIALIVAIVAVAKGFSKKSPPTGMGGGESGGMEPPTT